MSLLSLKKSKPTAKTTLHSVDSFIDDAISYAAGERLHQQETTSGTLTDIHRHKNDIRKTPCLKSVKCSGSQKQQKGMRHATFTLTPECITQLSLLSQDSNMAKSAIIRKWISEEFAKRLHTAGGDKKK